MDLYQVILLLPKTGDRILINGCEAEVEMNKGFEPETISSKYQYFPKKQLANRLDIILTMTTPDIAQLSNIKEQIIGEDIFIYFKDVHPCLIKSFFRGMTIDVKKVTMSFTGNTTDKEYLDYVTEVSNQLDAYQYTLSPPSNDHNMEPETNPEKERKVMVLKRKLTFK